MGKRSERSGVCALGKNRIQFDFEFEGKRYRPSIKRVPTEANLDRALKQLEGINERIERGTFVFAEEFPSYRFLKDVRGASTPRTCNEVFDSFIAHCESRLAKKDLAYVTVEDYRSILNLVWRPALGEKEFESVRYSDLVAEVDKYSQWSKKRYNNVVSVIRCAFSEGYRDLLDKRNPAEQLKTLKITMKDKEPIDPFPISEAEALIAAIHHDWGEAQGNYDEFRFFTGLRPSEELAVLVSDCDVVNGTLKVTKARVRGRDKDRPKNGVDRKIELCPRAREVLERQLALRERLKGLGLIQHEKVFFKETGEEIFNLQFGYERWKQTLTQTLKARSRDPYCARHSWASWLLMIGKNLGWAAKQNGHSVHVLLTNYARWLEGAGEADVAAIKAAMAGAPAKLRTQIESNQRRMSESLPILSSPPSLAVGRQYDIVLVRKCLKRKRRRCVPVRAFDPYTLSRGAPSTTRPSLRGYKTRA